MMDDVYFVAGDGPHGYVTIKGYLPAGKWLCDKARDAQQNGTIFHEVGIEGRVVEVSISCDPMNIEGAIYEIKILTK